MALTELRRAQLEKQMRAYYVPLRRADGATDTEIGSELKTIDPAWCEDYILAGEDLDASITPHDRTRRSSCLSKRMTRSETRECEAAVEAEARRIHACGVGTP